METSKYGININEKYAHACTHTHARTSANTYTLTNTPHSHARTHTGARTHAHTQTYRHIHAHGQAHTRKETNKKTARSNISKYISAYRFFVLQIVHNIKVISLGNALLHLNNMLMTFGLVLVWFHSATTQYRSCSADSSNLTEHIGMNVKLSECMWTSGTS